MLRVAICCGEGFASGFLAQKLNQDAAKEKIDNLISFKRIPFDDLPQQQDNFDIALIMTHIEWKVKTCPYDFKIPLYVIPFKAPIAPSVYDYLDDCEDILLIADGKGGLFRFPGEERTGSVIRLMSYRSWWNQIGKAYNKNHPDGYISFIENADDTKVEVHPDAAYEEKSGSRLLKRQEDE